ncbi:glycosyltransferase [Subtercola sp. YIM 133946]|uniref:glycosyltransferase n=1 Tax=Subtercola sp. YIM 133946 TaxID=3118909 RepID=UPI002F91F909
MELSIIGLDAVGDAEIGVWRTEEIDGHPVNFLPVYRGDNTVMRPKIPHVALMMWGVLKYRKQIQADVIQSHRITSGFVMRNLFRKATHVQFFHNDGEDSIALGNESYFKRFTRVFRFLEKSAVKNSSDVVIFNRSAAERLGRWGDNVRFSPTWYDDEYFYPGETKPPTVQTGKVLWVGRFEETKDPELAVRAVALTDSTYTLTMLGGGSLHQATRALAENLDVADRINIVGPVGKREVSDYLRSHDLLLMTSHHEGFPRAVVESLASGVPVVATAGGEPNGLVVEGINGTRITERTAKSAAEAIKRASGLEVGVAVESVAALKASLLVPYVLGREVSEVEVTG